MAESKHNGGQRDKTTGAMFARHNQPAAAAAETSQDDEAISAARALLAAIDAAVFPSAKPIPFYEQSVLIRRAVVRLLAHG